MKPVTYDVLFYAINALLLFSAIGAAVRGIKALKIRKNLAVSDKKVRFKYFITSALHTVSGFVIIFCYAIVLTLILLTCIFGEMPLAESLFVVAVLTKTLWGLLVWLTATGVLALSAVCIAVISCTGIIMSSLYGKYMSKKTGALITAHNMCSAGLVGVLLIFIIINLFR